MNRSICIHSNRNLHIVKDNIHSVIDYVESSQGIELVLSDNSLDEEKKKHFEKLSNKKFNYLLSPHQELTSNGYHCLMNSKGNYICSLGDDDRIIKLNSRELEHIPDNCIGIRPNFVVYTKENGISNFSNFSIMQDTPIKRINEYFQKCNGNNNTLYSFFDRNIYLPLINLINTFHPFKNNGYFDWVVVLCLIAEGKIIADPYSAVFYDNERWETNEKIKDSVEKLFTKDNLNIKLSNYLLMLLALDSFILLSRLDSSLDNEEKFQVASSVMLSYLKNFFNSLIKENFDSREMNLVLKLMSTNTLKDKLELMFELLEFIQPGKGHEYSYFYQKVTGQTI